MKWIGSTYLGKKNTEADVHPDQHKRNNFEGVKEEILKVYRIIKNRSDLGKTLDSNNGTETNDSNRQN